MFVAINRFYFSSIKHISMRGLVFFIFRFNILNSLAVSINFITFFQLVQLELNRLCKLFAPIITFSYSRVWKGRTKDHLSQGLQQKNPRVFSLGFFFLSIISGMHHTSGITHAKKIILKFLGLIVNEPLAESCRNDRKGTKVSFDKI